MGLLGDSWDDPKSNAIMQLAGGLLSGNFGKGVSDYGSVMAAGQDQALKRKFLQMQMEKGGIELDAEKQKLSDAAKARQVMIGYGLPGAQSKVGGPGIPQNVMSGLPSEFQTPAVGARPGYSAPQTDGNQKSDFFSHYMGLAEKYRAEGLPDQYAAAMATAEKFRPKYSTTPQQMMVGGKLTNVLVSEDGAMKTLDGFGVKPDMVEMDLGGAKKFVDKNSLSSGQSFNKTMTPGEIASNGLGWANFGLSKAAADRAKANDSKPQWIESLGGFADPKTQIVKPALDMQGRPIAGAGKAMTEDQGKATGWLVQAETAFKNMNAVTDQNPSAAKPGFNDALSAIPSFGLAGGAANMMRGADRQKFMQASSSLSEALLRAATGAGVNANEAKQKIEELTPIVGDSDEVIAQKKAAIPVYIESLKVRSGPGALKAASILGNTGGASGGWSIQKAN